MYIRQSDISMEASKLEQEPVVRIELTANGLQNREKLQLASRAVLYPLTDCTHTNNQRIENG